MLTFTIMMPAVVFLFFSHSGTLFLRIGIAVFFFFLGWYLTETAFNRSDCNESTASPCSLTATVSKTLGTGKDFRILLLKDGFNGTQQHALDGHGRLMLRNNTLSLTAGDMIAFRAKIRKPTNRGNPGEFDWETYCRVDNILWTVSAAGRDAVVLVRQGNRRHPRSVLFRIRDSIRCFLDGHSESYLNGMASPQTIAEARALLKGIILGDRSEIPHELRISFAKSGLIHQLAVSGLHVGIVILCTLICVQIGIRIVPQVLLWVPLKKLAAAVSIPAMIFYCLLAGANTPAVRSTIMGLVFAVGVLGGRKWDSVNSLLLAGLLILLFSPLSLFSVSFQLSFLAMAGIFIVLPALKRFTQKSASVENSAGNSHNTPSLRGQTASWIRYTVIAGTLTTIGAVVAVTPRTLQLFHSFPVYTIPANLLANVVLTLTLFFGFWASVTSLISSSIASILLLPAELSSGCVIKIAAFFSNLPGSTFTIRRLTVTEELLLWICAGLTLLTIRMPSRRLFYAVLVNCLCFCLCFSVNQWIRDHKPCLKTVFFNVGKGDAAFVEQNGCHAFLIDAGPADRYFDSGRSILQPFFLWNGTRTLDGFILSHPDMDHIGGFPFLMPLMKPAAIWWNPVEPAPSWMADISMQTEPEKPSIFNADRDRPPVRIGGAVIRFLNKRYRLDTSTNRHQGFNEATAVFRIEYGNTSFLFTGDLGRDGEKELLSADVPLTADVLKVGHHGSGSSSSRAFLEKVRPKFAVVSWPYPRTGGLPSQETLDRLEAAGAHIFWTGRDGAITIKTDGTRAVATIGKNTGQRWSATIKRKPELQSNR